LAALSQKFLPPADNNTLTCADSSFVSLTANSGAFTAATDPVTPNKTWGRRLLLLPLEVASAMMMRRYQRINREGCRAARGSETGKKGKKNEAFPQDCAPTRPQRLNVVVLLPACLLHPTEDHTVKAWGSQWG
jgi:hypothetical protein